MSNVTIVTGFLLLEFSEERMLQILHFVVFLAMYLMVMIGNLLIIILVTLNTHLHTPMYFFLINLSVVDLGSTSVTIPKAMFNALMNTRWISFYECAAQMFFFVHFLSSDIFLLTIMAYDRYVAICYPLHYVSVMNWGRCIQMMDTVHEVRQNATVVTEFILLGLSSNPEAQLILFGLFLLIYLVVLIGNTLLFLLISFNKSLHSPMYFFLGNLSLVDIGYTTSTVPKMLTNFLFQDRTISIAGCFSQMYFFISFGGIECLLLGVMAYDRYAAICHPLHYSVLMRPQVCIILAATAWILGLANSGVHSGMLSRLSFCQDNVIHHFFCDIPPLFQLSCSDTQANQIATFVVGGGVVMSSFLVTLVSYVYIAMAILRIRTKEGRLKAFSTCTSHLTVVNIYFGTIIFTYLKPNSTYSQEQDRALPVLYGIIVPMLNPIIYSLRNKDVKRTLWNAVGSSKQDKVINL
ncbi:olfactory receptor 1020-like [Sphaerodactylus townsendi]|uniref:olfactory receptor 1020-like n=1 Tax=Sphaerodactylus townsendi TaxID=933632 RepID=UPI002026AE20|nr:olfactory receptor 1020-like [Sphaerodactylus townsendi]